MAVQLPDLAIEAVSLDPAAAGAPVAVRAPVRGRFSLVAVSASAAAAGVRPGMTEAEGRATLASLRIRDREPALELLRLEQAAELLFAFGPAVEVAPPATLLVDIGPVRPEPEEAARVREAEAALLGLGHRAFAAIADDPDTARTVAAHRAARAPEEASEARREAQPTKVRSRPAPPARAPEEASEARREAQPTKVRSRPAPPARAPEEASEARREAQPTKVRSRPAPPARAPEELSPVVAAGRARWALSSLPVRALAWADRTEDPEGKLSAELLAAAEALFGLGVRDGAGLARLSAAELGTRFGRAGALLAERIRGTRCRPLRRFQPSDPVVEAFELDGPTEGLEVVLHLLRRLLDRWELRLGARQRAASAVRLELWVEPGLERTVPLDGPRAASSRQRVILDLRLNRPTRSAETVLSVAREQLGGALPGAVLAMAVEALCPQVDRGTQLDLFSRRADAAEALGALVGRLGAALGPDAVGSPVLIDTHRPEAAWSLAPLAVEAALAPLRPPPRPALPPPPPRVVAEEAGRPRTLPAVEPGLSVVAPQNSSGARAGGAGRDPSPVGFASLRASLARSPSPSVVASPPSSSPSEGSEARPRWPRPVPKRPDADPPPPLPPRPLELLDPPERAALLEQRSVLVWRGRRYRVASIRGGEQLATEWWRPEGPLERDYLRLDTEAGPALWAFIAPSGSAFVHGIFD